MRKQAEHRHSPLELDAGDSRPCSCSHTFPGLMTVPLNCEPTLFFSRRVPLELRTEKVIVMQNGTWLTNSEPFPLQWRFAVAWCMPTVSQRMRPRLLCEQTEGCHLHTLHKALPSRLTQDPLLMLTILSSCFSELPGKLS